MYIFPIFYRSSFTIFLPFNNSKSVVWGMTESIKLSELFTVISQKEMSDSYHGTRAKKYFQLYIFPHNHTESPQWTYLLLMCFINQLTGFIPRKHHPYKEISGRFCFYFIKEVNEDKIFKIRIEITASTISVYSNKAFLFDDNYFESKNIRESSNKGADGKTLKKYRLVTLTYYEMKCQDMDVNEGTRALYEEKDMFYTACYDFTQCLHYFAKKVAKKHPEYAKECDILSDFIKTWVKNKKEHINSLEVLSSKIAGYLTLDVRLNVNQNRLTKLKINHEDQIQMYEIVSGVYVAPWTKSLFEHGNSDLIAGFLLDTTWKVMAQYVTCILMGCAYNIGLPLAFGFGKSETKDLYTELLVKFQESTGVDLRAKIIESDQGTALKAAIKEFDMIHLACLRHLLVSLQYNEYSFIVSQLVSCTTSAEIEQVKNVMCEEYSHLPKKQKDVLNVALKKIGWTYTDTPHIVDEERWDSVSMETRLKYRMPSTTNSLESTHGHMNSDIPRRNELYTSILRIVEHMWDKVQNIEECVKRNYNYANRMTKRRLDNKSETISDEQMQYHTTQFHCECGENRLVSSMLGIDMICSHRLALTAKPDPCPDVKPPIIMANDHLEVEYNFLPPQVQKQPKSFNEMEIKYIVNQIKSFSHFKEKTSIEEWVKSKFSPENDQMFKDHYSSSINLIIEGISYFIAEKEKERQEKASREGIHNE